MNKRVVAARVLVARYSNPVRVEGTELGIKNEAPVLLHQNLIFLYVSITLLNHHG
jgi:hypothetical protein